MLYDGAFIYIFSLMRKSETFLDIKDTSNPRDERKIPT